MREGIARNECLNVSAIYNELLLAWRTLNSDLSTASDVELLEGPDVVYEQVHEPQLVRESHQDKQARGVQGNVERLLLELLIQLKGAEGNGKGDRPNKSFKEQTQ